MRHVIKIIQRNAVKLNIRDSVAGDRYEVTDISDTIWTNVLFLFFAPSAEIVPEEAAAG